MLFRKLLLLWECDLNEGRGPNMTAAVRMGGVLCVGTRVEIGCVWIQCGETAETPIKCSYQTLLQAHPHYLGDRHGRPHKMLII